MLPTGKVRVKAGAKVRVVALRGGKATAVLGRYAVKARPLVVARFPGNGLFTPKMVRKRVGGAR